MHEAPSLSVRELLASAQRYDGQIITLQGYALVGPEAHSIRNSKKEYDIWRRAFRSISDGDDLPAEVPCLAIANPETIAAGQRTITVTGKFVATFLKDGEVDLWGCNNSDGRESAILVRQER